MDIKRVYRFLIIALIIILSFFLLMPQASIPLKQKKGKISKETYIAPYDFSIIDKERTEEKIKDEQSRILPSYSFDLTTSLKLLEDTTKLFSKIEDIRKKGGERKEEKIKKLLPNLSSEEIKLIASADKNVFIEIEENIKNMMNICLEKGILPDGVIEKEIEITRKKKEKGTITLVENLLTESKIKNSNLKELKILSKQPTNIDELSWKIASSYLIPNLYFDKDATRKRIKENKEIEPIMVFVKKGDIIASEGEVIDGLTEAKFKAISEISKGISNKTIYRFIIIFLLFIFFIIAFIFKYQRDLKEEKIMAFSFISFFIIAFAKCLTIWMPDFWMYLPFSSFSIIVALLSSSLLSLFLTFILSILISFIFGLELNVLLLFLNSGLFSIFLLSLARKRADLIKVCLGIFFFNILLSLFLLEEPLRAKIIFSFSNAIIVYFLTISTLYVLELFFSTNFKLLELSDLNIPLLRDLFLEAPGTYHHSLITGTLAEDAALCIGANPILARTGSYYHDIGKIFNPEYFPENQKERKEISSPAILKSHIERGVSIAKIKHLPSEIIEIIQSHHGTSKIGDERYPGPLPNTKESAIVMLASLIDEKIRAYEKPSPDAIKSIVKEVIDEKMYSQELCEAPLTIKELKIIEESFINILITLFHAKDADDETKAIG
ncbi:MAG: HDIG domain-containing metalloprotein [bacterium]